MKKGHLDRIDLHEYLRRRAYDHALITTYTFGPAFFEEYCLEKCNSLQTNGNITVLVDRNTYEQLIQKAAAGGLQKANLRYLLHPVDVAGTFHSKIFLFARRDRGLLVIGSANFTRPGITSNAELVACYEYEVDKNEHSRSLFQTVFRYLRDIGIHAPGEALASNLLEIEREVPWLTEARDERTVDHTPTLLHNLDEPLWEQLKTEVAPPVDTVYVVSRFFDATPVLLDQIAQDLHPKRIHIFTQHGVPTINEPWLKHRLVQEGRTKIFLCTYRDAEYVQPLHAKAIAIEKDRRLVLAFGSANFTTAALLRTVRNGNAEILLVFRGLNRSVLHPETFFDPDQSAIQLEREHQLIPAWPDEERWTPLVYTIRLEEATMIEDTDKLRLIADVPTDCPLDKLYLEIRQMSLHPRQFQVRHDHERIYTATLSGEILHHLNNATAIVQLCALDEGGKTVQSNPVLLTNLQDIHTGLSVRRERRLQEAHQSALQFIAVLNTLVDTGDEAALRQFLTYCDIPVLEVVRPHVGHGLRLPWEGGKGMRNLGERNLRHFVDLHDAVVDFVERHFRKLHRHAKNGTVEGVTNFMHIFLAICGLLRSQIERVVYGFEAIITPMQPQDWHQYRTQLDLYFDKFRQLMDCLSRAYIPALLRQYTRKTIRERFGPELRHLCDICVELLALRDQIEEQRRTRLKLQRQGGGLITPKYFSGNLLEQTSWLRYCDTVQTLLRDVEHKMAG